MDINLTKMIKHWILTLTLFLCFLPATSLASNNKKTPNIIFIVADYMGYADTEPYGATDIKTPSLNALASQGIKFTNHYAAASSCIPSRASLMSGKYPSKVLQRFEHQKGRGLHSKNNNLVKGLKSNGYKTALIGKWHLGQEENFSPNDHGFDYFLGFNSWTLGYHNHLTSDGEPGLYRNKELVNESGYLTDIFTNEAMQFIDNNNKDPFFLYLSYNAGLPPYQKPDLAKSKWDTGWDVNKATRSDYVSMIESMDFGIGKVLDKLKTLNLDDNTLVIFTYDHGGRHLVDSGPLFHGFGTLWEGGIRVPLIMRWPNKFKVNDTFQTPTIAMDVTATMLDASQSKNIATSLDGTSLLEITAQPDNYVDRSLYFKGRKMKAIRKQNWKYIVDGYSQLLFNLEVDISERENVFHKHIKKANELKLEIENWEESLVTQ